MPPKGKSPTPEALANQTKAIRKLWEDSAYRAKILAYLPKGPKSPDHRRKLSLAMKRLWKTPRYGEKHQGLKNISPETEKQRVEKIRSWSRKRFADPDIKAAILQKLESGKEAAAHRLTTAQKEQRRLKHRQNMIASLDKLLAGKKKYLATLTTEERYEAAKKAFHGWTNARLSKFLSNMTTEQRSEYFTALVKKVWQSRDIATKKAIMHKVYKSASKQPNRLEQEIGEYLEKHFPKEWVYNKEGQYIINGLKPDFVNINGKKAVIEVFGDYWHRNENPEKRIQRLKDAGYTCYVVWEKDFHRDPTCLLRLDHQ